MHIPPLLSVRAFFNSGPSAAPGERKAQVPARSARVLSQASGHRATIGLQLSGSGPAADRGHATCSCNSHIVHTRRLEAERPGRQVRTQVMSGASHVHPKRPASGPNPTKPLSHTPYVRSGRTIRDSRGSHSRRPRNDPMTQWKTNKPTWKLPNAFGRCTKQAEQIG